MEPEFQDPAKSQQRDTTSHLTTNHILQTKAAILILIWPTVLFPTVEHLITFPILGTI